MEIGTGNQKNRLIDVSHFFSHSFSFLLLIILFIKSENAKSALSLALAFPVFASILANLSSQS